MLLGAGCRKTTARRGVPASMLRTYRARLRRTGSIHKSVFHSSAYLPRLAGGSRATAMPIALVAQRPSGPEHRAA